MELSPDGYRGVLRGRLSSSQTNFLNFTIRDSSCGKVMCVKNSVHSGEGGMHGKGDMCGEGGSCMVKAGHAWQGACVVKWGMHDKGGVSGKRVGVWQGGVHGEVGMHGKGGHAWQGEDRCGKRVCVCDKRGNAW